MGEPEIVTLLLPARPVGVTGFTIEFSAHSETWTAFSPTDATPTGFEDPTALIAITDLNADSEYVIDGINTPLGNAIAASAVGNVFRCRWKTATGYTNPGFVFRV